MGLELLLLVVIIVFLIGLMFLYRSWNRDQSATPRQSRSEENSVEYASSAPPQEQAKKREETTPPAGAVTQPSSPPQPTVNEDIDDYAEIEEESVMPEPEPKPEKPAEIQFGDVVDWMDEITEEIHETAGGLYDLESTEEMPPNDIDIAYPPPKPRPVQPATTAHFSAFYPEEVQPEQRYGIYIYAHAESMLAKINQDVQKFKEELGGVVPESRMAKDSKSLAHGTKITVLLESEEVEFEPDILTKRWHGDWTRYEFEFRPTANLVDETIFVRASVMVLGFEIAKIKFAIDVSAPQAQVMNMSVEGDAPTNPFARAKMQSTTTAGYDKIFISYSRKDKLIAEAFKIMQEAAGNDVFFDVDDIRTGEDWQAAIARAIDEADYFQLFWSENSANSEWCGYEWDYALNYRCKENKCREFIRPVWWSAPMPPPPESLKHLNFRRLSLQTLMQLS